MQRMSPHSNAQMGGDDSRTDLAGRSARGGLLVLAGRGAQTLVYLVSGMILARLLTPADFGLYAMVGSLIALVTAFRDFGFPMAAVQRKSLETEQANGLFWVAMKLNLLTGAFVALMAPVLAWFYGEPRIAGITLVMAAAVFCLGLGIVHSGLLVRRMQFGRVAAIDAGATLVGFAAGVASAVAGAGYWALVFLYLGTAVARTAALWSFCRWRPARPKSASGEHPPGVREMLTYGGTYTAYKLLHHAGYNVDRVLIGYFIGANAIGFYDNAFRWSRYPQQSFSAPLLDVAVSGLSRLQDDPHGYRAFCRRAFAPVFALVLPTLVFLAIDARNAILVLLGPQWMESVPIFRWLCLSGIAGCILSLTQWLYLSRGQTRRMLKWAFVATPVMIAGAVAGLHWGALGVAVGFTVATGLLAFPAVRFCLARSPVTMRDFGGVLWRPFVCCAAAAAAVGLLPAPWRESAPLLQLLANLLLFGSAYLASWMMLPGGRTTLAELFTVVWRHSLGQRDLAGTVEST